MKPNRVIFHHSAIHSTNHQFDAINGYHKTRGFTKSKLGFYVGYHYVIEPDGTIKQAREETEIGMHDTGENGNSLGVCIVGNFNTRLPTEEQCAAAARLVAGIRALWKIPVTRFEPHRWDDDTDCPGRMMPDNWLAREYLTREANIMHRLFWLIGEKFNLL